ncbi:MAG: sugar phosphate isomerase/epimerase [Intestinibacter sp.]|uniref:sugar phosphate isomerase/epimerase family protein n=1 Tax=Intestinibacter sp. TaxID=1965304 RepID=UPI0025C4531F|nr:TIM barrel protein [Intestinibacter sp.]MCI6736541.1 sugar phosphate isomerase/epimerase [Intestinibacter sp.]
MKVYISQLVETEKIKGILEKYDVGLEIVLFASPYCLDRQDEFIENYKEELGDLYGKIDISIHGPFVELCPGTRDELISKVTNYRMQQAYDVAKKMNAKYMVYHNGYYPNTYSYIEWMQNAPTFWQNFLQDKKDDGIKVHIENVFEDDYFILNELMEEIADDKTSMCLDVGHVSAYSKIDVMEWMKILNKYIKHMHIHNNCGDRDSHLGINKGDLDIMEILNLVKDKDITISLEITNLDELEESLEILYKNGFITDRKL